MNKINRKKIEKIIFRFARISVREDRLTISSVSAYRSSEHLFQSLILLGISRRRWPGAGAAVDGGRGAAAAAQHPLHPGGRPRLQRRVMAQQGSQFKKGYRC